MAVKDYSTTPSSNTSIASISVAEGCSPGNINDAIRQLMADLKDGDYGTTGVKLDLIAESTAAAGVTIDGVLIKDGGLTLSVALPVASGGTGGTSAAAARTALGIGSVENTALSTWAGSSNLTTLGTIATGVWSGTAVAVNKGGTGATSASAARTNLGLADGATGTIGTTIQAYDANTAKINVVQTWSVAQRGTITTLTDGATVTPDFGVTNDFGVTLGGNRTVANPSNITVGQKGVLIIKQDGTGSRTITWGSYYKWSGGTAPTLTTTASATDRVQYHVISSTEIHCTWLGDLK